MNKNASLIIGIKSNVTNNRKERSVHKTSIIVVGLAIYNRQGKKDISFEDHCLIVNHELVRYKFQPFELQLHKQ